MRIKLQNRPWSTVENKTTILSKCMNEHRVLTMPQERHFDYMKKGPMYAWF